MTNDEIRIAIARHLGIPNIFSYALPEKTVNCNIPKYSEDYGAIRPLIMRLTDPEKIIFVLHLLSALNIRDDQTPEPLEMFAFSMAGPEELTEAYMKVKGIYAE